jgi:hypothetical protein
MVKKNYNLLVLIFLLLTWISFWFSINTKPDEINFFSNFSIVSIINTLRISVPLLLSIILTLFVILLIFKKKKFDKKLITEPIFLFIIYFFLQCIGLYFNNKLNFFDLNNSYLVILGIGSMQIFVLLNIFNKNKNLNLFLLSGIFVIASAILILLVSIINNNNSKDLLYLYYFIDLDQKLFEQIFPRVTGLARMIALVNLAILTSFLFIEKKGTIQIFEFFFIIILSTLIWSFQSRGAMLCFYTCVIILIFFYKKYNFRKKILAIFFIIFFPIIIFETYKFYKINMFNQKISSNQLEERERKIEEFYRLNENRIIKSKEQGTSGRINLWKYMIEKYDKKNIFGYGPQADRFLISKTLNQQFGNNVSNGFLYALACGGYFALAIFILISLKILMFIYRSIFLTKIFQIKYFFIEKLATIYLIFFSIRVLFENSYAVFSIDFLITLICFLILNNFFLKKNYLTFKV